MEKAKIHSFESMGTVDGPGIRYVVFFQGCLLRCKYCHNRDTWNINEGKEYTVDEIMEKVRRSKPYMKDNGGITVSGGEPLLQAKFLIELFKACKKENINTCIDTAGSLPINKDISELLKLTDLVLLDIKHIDSKKCKELTGMDNTNELAFGKYLSEKNIPIWIRQVLVPGLTDDEDDLKKTREYIDTLKTVEKIEILPYHTLGKHKWIDIEGKYELEDIKEPSIASIKLAEKILMC